MKVSRGDVLGRLRMLAASGHGRLRAASLARRHSALYRAVLHHFGSFDAARRAAGLAPLPKARRWSLDLVVSELRRLHRSGVRIAFTELRAAGRHDVLSAAEVYAGGLPRARRLARIPTPARTYRDPEPWDGDRVIEELQDLHAAGRSIANSRVDARLVAAAIDYFGSYRAAVEAAGFDYDQIRLRRPPYTDEELLADLRALARRRPAATLTDVHRDPRSKSWWLRFGSIEAAARAAGIRSWPKRLIRRVMSAREVVAAIRARQTAGLLVFRESVAREDYHLLHSALRHFGSWKRALDAAGVADDSPSSRWNRRAVLAALRDRQKRGLRMDPSSVLRDDPPLYHAVRRHLGTYLAVASKFGARSRVETWSRERVIEALRRAAAANRTRRRELSSGLVCACMRYFGSLFAAREAAGIAHPRPGWTRERVLEELRARLRRGGVLVKAQVGGALSSAAGRCFGSFTAAREAALASLAARRSQRQR